MSETLTGSCLCGAIRYSVKGPITELRACHCTNCQKASGAGGSVNAVVQRANFTLVSGTPKRYAGKADSGRTLFRYFCGECGSPIYSQRETTPDTLVLRAGTLDNPGAMKITTHIWTKSARNWAHMEDGTTQVPGQPS